MLKNSVLNGRRVLITGNTGFIGSWLSLFLKQFNIDMIGYSKRCPSKPCLYDIIRDRLNIETNFGDVSDYRSLKKVVKEFSPEIVIHLAAQPLVLRSYVNPIDTFKTNVMGTVNLLELLEKVDSIRSVIVMTSDKVYKNKNIMHHFREGDGLGGRDPYSASKSCQDIVTHSFLESFFIEKDVGIATIRAGNVIGGGDWGEDRLIPDIVRHLTRGDVVKLRHPQSTRPWQHVLEPVYGIINLAEKLIQQPRKFSGPWNIGPTISNLTVEDMTSKFINYWGEGNYTVENSDGPKEESFLSLDSSKFFNSFGWSQMWDVGRAIEETAKWYKDYYSNKDIIELTELQILNYANEFS